MRKINLLFGSLMIIAGVLGFFVSVPAYGIFPWVMSWILFILVGVGILIHDHPQEN